jgi:hypothetical protein
MGWWLPQFVDRFVDRVTGRNRCKEFGVEPICRPLRQAGVAISPSGYYAAWARPPPARAVRNAALEKQILRVIRTAGNGAAPGRCGTS